MQLIEHCNRRSKQELAFHGPRFGFLALPVTTLSIFLVNSVNKMLSLAGWKVLSAGAPEASSVKCVQAHPAQAACPFVSTRCPSSAVQWALSGQPQC